MPLLRKSRRAVILNVTSEWGSNSSQSKEDIYIPAVAYKASKAAVNSYTIGLARELQAEGIRVNCVTPGLTSTKINGFASGGKTAKDGAKVLLPWALMNEMDSTGNLMELSPFVENTNKRVLGLNIGGDGKELPW